MICCRIALTSATWQWMQITDAEGTAIYSWMQQTKLRRLLAKRTSFCISGMQADTWCCCADTWRTATDPAVAVSVARTLGHTTAGRQVDELLRHHLFAAPLLLSIDMRLLLPHRICVIHRFQDAGPASLYKQAGYMSDKADSVLVRLLGLDRRYLMRKQQR